MAARRRTRQTYAGGHTTRAAPRRRRHPRWSGRACWRACPRGIFSNFVHSPLPRAAHGACRWPSSLDCAKLICHELIRKLLVATVAAWGAKRTAAAKTLCHELVRKLLVATVAARGAKRTADRYTAKRGDSTDAAFGTEERCSTVAAQRSATISAAGGFDAAGPGSNLSTGRASVP